MYNKNLDYSATVVFPFNDTNCDAIIFLLVGIFFIPEEMIKPRSLLDEWSRLDVLFSAQVASK